MRRSILAGFIPLCLLACDATDSEDAGTTPADARVDAGVPVQDAGGGEDATPGDTGTSTTTYPRISCDTIATACVQVEAAQASELFNVLNELESGTTVVLGAGTFDLNNAATIRDADHITLTGQGIDVTILSFLNQPAQANGVDVVADDFIISHLTITDSKKDGLRIEDSERVWIDHIKVTWSGGPLTTNGSYGIYPVRCTDVLMEFSEAYNASDAGLYVGQSINVIVRNNIAKQNVAGLEIENTQYADVYENLVEENAGGLLVFDLPGNPVIGRDISIHHNTIRRNNRANFAPSGTTVSQIPAGTGTFALASRRVEIRNNTFFDNNTTDIAILSGLAIRSSTAAWAIPVADARGNLEGLDLINTGTHYLNFRSYDVLVHDNTHDMSGTMPDDSDQMARPLGVLLAVLFFGTEVDELLYDGIGDTVDPMVPANNTNLNHVCIANEGTATFAVLDLPKLGAMVDMGMLPSIADIYRPEAPFAPFDCNTLSSGPIVPVMLPFGD